MYHFLGNLVSPTGNRARLAILMFHRVLLRPDPLLADEIDAAEFERHMEFVGREFNVLPLAEACARLHRNTLPARALSLTFDDGYANNADVALPILLRHQLTATFFVATGFLDGGTMFNDGIIEIVRTAPAGAHDLSALGLPPLTLNGDASRRAAIDALIPQFKYLPLGEREERVFELADAIGGIPPENLMMRPADVLRLAKSGMQIGGHTVNHPILRQLDDREAQAEIVAGKRRLEEITDAPVTLFAYPNGKPGGDYDARHVELVRRAGFAAAVTTVNGVAGPESDRYQLPRCGLWNQSPERLGARLLANCLHPVNPGALAGADAAAMHAPAHRVFEER
jgi:peptidoglycan/xylan/chitin deacetylase (PgdA/CDA1 family)